MSEITDQTAVKLMEGHYPATIDGQIVVSTHTLIVNEDSKVEIFPFFQEGDKFKLLLQIYFDDGEERPKIAVEADTNDVTLSYIKATRKFAQGSFATGKSIAFAAGGGYDYFISVFITTIGKARDFAATINYVITKEARSE